MYPCLECVVQLLNYLVIKAQERFSIQTQKMMKILLLSLVPFQPSRWSGFRLVLGIWLY